MPEKDTLDRALRQGLQRSTAIAPTAAADLTTAVGTRRARRRRRQLQRRLALGSLAVLGVVAVIAAWPRPQESTYIETVPGPPVSSVAEPISQLTPGWHDLDTGPVPSSGPTYLASTDDHLVVVNEAGIYALGLATGEWRKLDDPPFDWRRPAPEAGTGLAMDIVGVGRDIVAVQRAERSQSAKLDPSTGRWSDLGELPPKDSIGSTNYSVLVFTATHVFDLWNGAVLDLDTSAWAPMARPSPFWLDTKPVWTGSELVLTTWGPRSGWAWSSDGQSVRPIDPPPEEMRGTGNVISDTAATAVDGRIVVVTDGPGLDGLGGRAAALDPLTGNWTALAPYGGESSEGCPSQIATVAGVVVLEQCLIGDPLALIGEAWQSTGAAPSAARGQWVTAAGTLVSWSSPDNGPDSAAVWVPEGSGPKPSETTSTSPAVLSTVAPVDLTSLAPGWHDIDTTGLPEAFASSMVWTGEQLVVALNRSWEAGTPLPGPEVLAFTPAEGLWQRFDPPPFPNSANVTLARAGAAIVAVQESGTDPASASLDLTSGAWTDLGRVPVSRQLLSVGASVRTVDNNIELVWTGTRLLDITHGAVLDPGSGRWSALPLPTDLVAFSGGLYAEAAWTGTEVRMVGWGNQPALGWDRDGTEFRSLPNIPADIAGTSGVGSSATGLGTRSAIVVSGGAFTRTNAARFDFATSRWAALPPLPGVRVDNSCPGPSAQTAETLLIRPCYDLPPQILVDDVWKPMAGPLPPAGYGVLLGTDKGVFAWAGADGSELNEPRSLAVAIWISPR